MVNDTGRTPATRRIRRLKSPGAVDVEVGPDGTPGRLQLAGRWCDVTLVRRPWRVDQHWWRESPTSRMYYRVAPEDGPPLTIYQDLVTGSWFRQEY